MFKPFFKLDKKIMLHKRFKNSKTSSTLRINEISNKLINEGKHIYKFGLGQSPFPVPEILVKTLKKNAHKKDYLNVSGLLELRKAVSQYHTKLNLYNYSEENVIIGPGSKELIFQCQMVTKMPLILSKPSWVSYEPQANFLEKEIFWINTSKETKQEIEQMNKTIKNLSDAKKKEYIDTDEDTTYYLKQYMEDNDLDFNETFIETLKKSARNVGRHFKNKYMRPRPYVIAEKLGMPMKYLDTETAHSPAYPSNHALQAKVVANYYSKIYPAHQDKLFEMADKSGEGRVNAGIHYPSDKTAGYKVADDMMEYILDWDAHNNVIDEDAPVNATGAAVSTDTPLVRSRNRYKDKNKKEAEKLYTRILKRYDY